MLREPDTEGLRPAHGLRIGMFDPESSRFHRERRPKIRARVALELKLEMQQRPQRPAAGLVDNAGDDRLMIQDFGSPWRM